MKQCAVMFVNPVREWIPHPEVMRAMGFLVREITDWPTDDAAVRDFHVVIVRVKEIQTAPMLAARLRAKPHFGRRLLIALVPASTSPANRRAAEASGFDEVVPESCDTRQLTTRILRSLRTRPELRCVLPPPERRRSAA